VIQYEAVRHENGKIRIIEDVNGEKSYVTKGKRRYFDDEEAADVITSKQRNNERKAKQWMSNKNKDRTRVNI
jgi:hypothetical protein